MRFSAAAIVDVGASVGIGSQRLPANGNARRAIGGRALGGDQSPRRAAVTVPKDFATAGALARKRRALGPSHGQSTLVAGGAMPSFGIYRNDVENHNQPLNFGSFAGLLLANGRPFTFKVCKFSRDARTCNTTLTRLICVRARRA